MAEPLPDPDAGTLLPPVPGPLPIPLPPLAPPQPIPFPEPTIPFPWSPFHICRIDLKAGCYRLPSARIRHQHLQRHDARGDSGGHTTISGDLYRFLRISLPFPPRGVTTLASPPLASTIFSLPLGIPIYAAISTTRTSK